MQGFELVLSVIINITAEDMTQKLLICLMQDLYKKIAVKLMTLKPKYTLKMDVATEMAFYVVFEEAQFIPTDTGVLIKNICNQIQKQYAC